MDLPVSAAAERNKDPILSVLRSVLPPAGQVLEIASGTGQHVCHFAQALPGIRWQPTEADPLQLPGLAARIANTGLGNVSAPLVLDVRAAWSVAGPYDAMLCINMIHISPWSATLALLRGANRLLQPNGLLILYGPYLVDGTAVESNLEFDASLKRRDPEWGLRDLEDVTRAASAEGLQRQRVVAMPANNLTVVFRRWDRPDRSGK
jgi:SAM-dependent methyltransferase